MIGTDELRALSTALSHARSMVRTDVEKGLQRSRIRSCDDVWPTHKYAREIVTGVQHLVGATHKLPVLLKDARLFKRKDVSGCTKTQEAFSHARGVHRDQTAGLHREYQQS